MQLSVDLHLSRLQAGRKEAEALAGILLKLRSELERFGGRRKAIELALQARALRDELRQIKATFLPVLEQVVEKIFALNNAAITFNRTVSVAHLPQTQFLQCRVDLTQLLAAVAELDVIVTPEMEQLAASAQGMEALVENGAARPTLPQFLAGRQELSSILPCRIPASSAESSTWRVGGWSPEQERLCGRTSSHGCQWS
jgi:hypothetical protein